MPLTNKQKKAYLKHSHRCPFCKSENIEGEAVEIDDELLEAYCPICQMVVIPEEAVLQYLLNKSDLKIDDVKNEMRKAKGK